ncbi:MAG: internalization-related competence protein ComEC/Rec2 [Myxococcales bacterium]|nr:internalization-related competence protein ComEC/Rec2 [Myxococcales bacterium]
MAGIVEWAVRTQPNGPVVDRCEMQLRPLRVPAPLTCAIVLAALIGLLPRPGHRVLPAGTQADDRIADRVIGTVGGPVVRTSRGFAGPLYNDGSTIWLWSEAPLQSGDRIAATGKLRTPRGLLDPGVPDRSAMIAGRGAVWEMSATSIEHLGEDLDVSARMWRWAFATQTSWVAAIDAANDDDVIGRAALRGIVTGERGEVPPELDQRWRTVGIYHVLSVSGLHLAVVAGLAFALLRRLIAGSPFGGRIRPARWAAPPALLIAIAYTMITGAQLATLRSLVVVAIVLVGQMLDRPLRLVDALGVAAILVLLWRPDDLYDPSFQLSFVAALTLALRPAAPRAEGLGARAWQWVCRGFVTSAWVAITTAPITAYQFHQVAAGGVVGNLVLTPVVELVALPLGLAGLALGYASPAIGQVLLHAAAWIVARIDDLAALLAHRVPVGSISVASTAAAVALVVVSVWLASRPRRTRAELAGWLALCMTWTLARSPAPPGMLRVTYLDVGQGDAAVIELPDGAVWLVDAGGIANARDLAAASAPGRAIAGVLGNYDHTSIDLAILSHPHPDHYLGFAALAESTPIRELWTVDERMLDAPPDPRSTVPGFSAIAAALASHGTAIRHPPLGIVREQAGAVLEVWAPRYESGTGPPFEAADPVRTVNDNSLVITLRYAGRVLLFAGDIEVEGEQAVVAAGLSHADVVKVPHHGSPTSSGAALVTATHPMLAVISCGAGNSFGFPSIAVVERWRAAGAQVERTDLSGAITVTVDLGGVLRVDRFAADSP